MTVVPRVRVREKGIIQDEGARVRVTVEGIPQGTVATVSVGVKGLFRARVIARISAEMVI